MLKLTAISVVALVLSVFSAQAFAQTATPTETTTTPTTTVTATATPTPTGEVQGTSDDVVVPSAAPATGYGTVK